MAVRRRQWTRVLVPLLLAVIVGGASLGVGLMLTRGSVSFDQATSKEEMGYGGAVSDQYAARSSAPEALTDQSMGGSAADSAALSKATPSDSMIVRNASVDIRVKSVDAAISRVRSAISKYDAEITDLSIYSGDPGPRPLAESEAAAPSSASMTIRVPAAKLEALKAEIAKTGSVLTQSSSANDVTQQYVDMDARLRNLKAEEARLRGFFDRATKVSDLLDVERELSRVRGEIESMQAQVDYLERQVAKASLFVNLSEPGPVVRPERGDWGFLEAITQGIQGAAKVVTTLITGFIALLPLALFVGLIWLVIAALRRRSRKLQSLDGREPEANVASGAGPEE